MAAFRQKRILIEIKTLNQKIETIMDIEERLHTYLDKDPQIDPSAYVSKTAVLVGDVRIAKDAPIFKTVQWCIWPTTPA